MATYVEKLQLLEEHLSFQRRQLASGINKKTVTAKFAAEKIAILTEIVDDYRDGVGEMPEEQVKRITELEARMAAMEKVIGVGDKLIQMDGANYVIPPETPQWRAWHRFFHEINDPRVYTKGALKVPSLWPDQ